MARNKPSRPTDAELEILRVLWDEGPSTVRIVHEVLSQNRNTGYTTILKLLQNMTEKGFVTRDESQRSHIYQAVLQEEQTQRQLVTDLLNRAFGGASDKLVMQTLLARRISSEELAEIRKFLDELEGA